MADSGAALELESRLHAGRRRWRTYIHGSVEESPSGDLSRSLDRPGAKTPLPYPRIEIHHGSFIVSLKKHAINQWNNRVTNHRECYSPVLDSVSERLEADLAARFSISNDAWTRRDNSPWHSGRSPERSRPCLTTHRTCRAGPGEGPSGIRSEIV